MASEVGLVSDLTRFKRSSSPSVPGRVRSSPSRRMSVRNVQVRTRMRCPVPERRVARTSLMCHCNLYHSKWRLAAYGGFSSEENIIVLEARSILHAVRHAESNYPSGRLLIFPSNLALVPALCKGHSFFTLLSVMRRIFASGFRAGFVLSFKGNRFFNRDYDPSKSLLHVRAQRIARSSPAQTNDQDSLSPSLKGLPSLGRRIASPFWCLMVLVFR